MRMLSEDDVDIRDMSAAELDAAWDLWFDLAQSTNETDPPYTHGVFAGGDRPAVMAIPDVIPRDAERLAAEPRICAGLLARLMSDLSEDLWCAGWLHDLEHDLWGALQGTSSTRLSPPELEQLRYLSDKCGGWIVWDDRGTGRRWVPLAEWRAQHEVWVGRQSSLD